MKNVSYIICGIFLFICYSISYVSFQNIRLDYKQKQYQDSSIFIPPVALKILAGEFKGLFADYALIEAASIVGSKGKITEGQWDTICHLYKQTIALDPYFEQSYFLIQGTLPWYTKRCDLAVSLVGVSKKARFWDWRPSFFIGFDYFYFIKDNRLASEYLMDASSIFDAPPLLATFAARLAQESGNNQLSISFLEMMVEREYDIEKKEMLLRRIQAHKAILVIERDIQKYKSVFGKYPSSLQMLVKDGIAVGLPVNPYGKQFIYNPEDGSLKF